jgi:hypothetical protein
MGEPMDRADIERPDWADTSCGPCGVDARVLHVDRYGNCLLSLRAGFEAPGPVSWLRMSWGQRRACAPWNAYADIGPAKSAALRQPGISGTGGQPGPAAEALGLRRGDSVRLLWG